MDNPIFPGCNYLIVVGATIEEESRMRAATSGRQIPLFFSMTVLDAQKVASLLSRTLGFVVFRNGISEMDFDEVVTLAHSKTSPILAIETEYDEGKLRHEIDEFIRGMLPNGLESYAVAAADSIFPSFFADIGSFRLTQPDQMEGDRLLHFALVGGELVGHLAIRMKTATLATLKPKTAISPELVVQEAANQFIGLITQGLVKLGIPAKVGLPTVFDLTKIPEVRTLAFFPSVFISDKADAMRVGLGFLELSGAPLFDMSAIKPETNADIEFL